MKGFERPITIFLLAVLVTALLVDLSEAYAVGQSKFGNIEKFPYQIMLIGKRLWQKRILCGGTLLDKRWILSAAHCTIGVTHFDVFLGTKSLDETKQTGLVMRSNKFITHEDFNLITAANDIALIKLPEDIKFTARIQPALLPYDHKNDAFTGSTGVASGWGAAEEMTNSDEMQFTELKVISNEACAEEYDVVAEGVLCAKGLKDETVCSGDSGGPLVLKGTQMVIGITSFGPADGCETNIPGGFTRVTNYLKWIDSKIGHHLQKNHTLHHRHHNSHKKSSQMQEMLTKIMKSSPKMDEENKV